MCGAPAGEARVLGMRLNRSQGMRPRRVRGAATTVVQCRNCELIFADPQPVPGSIADHYSMDAESYFVDPARSWGQPLPLWVERFRKLRDHLPGIDAPRVIDVGVGAGSSASSLMEAGFEVHGFEPVPQFRDMATRALGLSSDRIKLAGMEDAEFEAGAFDVVNFNAVLEHLYDPGASIERALKWLKPGGLVVAEVPNAGYLMSRIANLFFALQRANMVTHISPMHPPFHLYEFAAKSFEAHGRKAGYALVQSHVEVCTIRNMPRIAHPLLRAIMSATGTGMQRHVILRKT